MSSADTKLSELENGKSIDEQSPAVLLRSASRDDDGRKRRTGTVWTATAHVITAVIGSGVLSLAWSMAQLGWLSGPPVLLAFAFVTYYTSLLLADCYRDPVTGKRHYTYQDAVEATLGGAKIWICGLVQYTNLVGTSIGYTITASISMVAISRSNCFHMNGRSSACQVSNNPYMAMFGVVQIFLSQIPDFDQLWWLSIVAAVMSFSYSLIGLGLGIAKTFESGHSYGTATGVSVGSQVSEIKKVWQAFQALGNVAFAYSFSMILIEIQDTLKSPPEEKKTMKRATLLGVITTTLFYISVGSFGYAAFGNNAPGNLLTGFGFYNPFWLVDFANACIVVHLVGAYQVYCQPVFAYVEKWASNLWPKSRFVNQEFKIPIPFLNSSFRFNLFRFLWRSMFVIVTTIASMLLPFFNDILGLLGALGFWPLTVYFPIEMYIKQTNLARWSTRWVGLMILDVVCLLVSIAAALGSVEGIAQSLKSYKPFGS